MSYKFFKNIKDMFIKDPKLTHCCICKVKLDGTQKNAMVIIPVEKKPYEEGICDSCADKWYKGEI